MWESYIAGVLLALMLVSLVILWADGRLQDARREQRLRDRAERDG